LCAYTGPDSDGWAVVLTVTPGTFDITAETAFEFDIVNGETPALSKIDDTHYLCAYTGQGDDGWAVVLTVSSSNWTISKGIPFEFDPEASIGSTESGVESGGGVAPDLVRIDQDHHLCAYRGADLDGWAVVLTVDTDTWQISKKTPFEFDPDTGQMPELYQIDMGHYVCSYEGPPESGGWLGDLVDMAAVTILRVNLASWTISTKTLTSTYGEEGDAPDIAVIDAQHFISVYDGMWWDGWAVILAVELNIKP